MTQPLGIALALAISASNPGVSLTLATSYSTVLVTEARKNELDPWLPYAIIRHESRWSANVLRQETDGSCSVGLGQINVPGCDPARMAPLRDPAENIRRTTKLLHLMKMLCPKVWRKKKCVQGGWIGLYNPGDSFYSKTILLLVE